LSAALSVAHESRILVELLVLARIFFSRNHSTLLDETRHFNSGQATRSLEKCFPDCTRSYSLSTRPLVYITAGVGSCFFDNWQLHRRFQEVTTGLREELAMASGPVNISGLSVRCSGEPALFNLRILEARLTLPTQQICKCTVHARGCKKNMTDNRIPILQEINIVSVF
jgi:hypothetical protein